MLRKLVLTNIKNSKSRSILVCLTVVACTSLFFISLTMNDTMKKIYLEVLTEQIGTSHIMVTKQQNDNMDNSFSPNIIEPFIKDFNYNVGSYTCTAQYNKDGINYDFELDGFDYKEIKLIYNIDVERAASEMPFEGPKMIVSKSLADSLDLSLGDNIKLKIGESFFRFRICVIAKDSSIFSDTDKILAVVPKEYLASINGHIGNINILYIGLPDKNKIQTTIKELSVKLEKYNISDLYNSKEVDSYLKKTTSTYLIPVILMIVIGIYIQYNSFKVLAIERLPLVKIIRSLGTSKIGSILLLSCESLILGILGAVIGCFAGIIILYSLSKFVSLPFLEGNNVAGIAFHIKDIIISLLIGALMSVAGSILPIVKIVNRSIVGIATDNEKNSEANRSNDTSNVIVLLFMAFLLFMFIKIPTMFGNILSLIIVITLIILLIPLMCRWAVMIMEKKRFIGDFYYYALKQAHNKYLYSSITTLSLLISCTISISVIFGGVINTINDYYDDMKFDMRLYGDYLDNSLLHSITQVKGIDDCCGMYESMGVMTTDGDLVRLVQGFEEKTFDYWNMSLSEKDKNNFLKMSDIRVVLISKAVSEILDKKVGDYLEFDLPVGIRSYRVVGIFNSIEANGSFVILPKSYMEVDFKCRKFTNILLKVPEDSVKISKILKSKFSEDINYCSINEEKKVQDVSINRSNFKIVFLFLLIILLLSSLIIFNNSVISYIYKIKDYSIMRSCGMSIKQNNKILFFEILITLILSWCVGGISSIFMIKIINDFIKNYSFAISIHIESTEIISYITGTIVLLLLGYWIQVRKNEKLNIMNSIKGE